MTMSPKVVTTRELAVMLASSVAACAGLALGGCIGSTSTTSAVKAAAARPANVPQAPTAGQWRGDGGRFNPLAVSSAGLIANRPVEITPRPVAPAASATASTAQNTTAVARTAAAVQPVASQPVAPSAATEILGQAMAKGSSSDLDAGPRGGGVNVMQVSFAVEGADFDPAITRDGQKIVFASTQHRATADIYIKDVQGRAVTQLTSDPANDIMPSLSPDGSRIAFASNRSGAWNIYVMPITGGRAIQLTSGSADDLHPSWSPDGRQIVFSRLGQMSGQWEMWVTDVANTGASRFIGYGLFPEWSPTTGTGPQGGDLIAFQRSRERGDRSFGVWTVELKGGNAGNATEIAASPTAACINPTWSPDGQWIAFATVPNASAWTNAAEGRPGQADLWMVDLAGSSRINLTSGLAVNLMPTFGPKNQVFFVSDRGGVDTIWQMDTTPVVQLAALNLKGAKSAVASTGASNAAKSPAKPQTPEAEPAEAVAGAEEEPAGEQE